MHVRPVKALLAPVATALALSACGATGAASTSPKTSTGTATSPSTATSTRTTTGHTPAQSPPSGHGRRTAPARRRGAPPAAHPPGVGRAQRVRALGTTLVVMVTSVIDPLRGSGASVPPGTRPAGVQVSVRNAGPGGYDSSATGDFSLLSATGPAAPAFVARGPCQTQDRDFMNAISAGQMRMGCVSFALPAGQRPTTVRFSPNGGRAGHRVTWAVH
jgi:hypothetical protein